MSLRAPPIRRPVLRWIAWCTGTISSGGGQRCRTHAERKGSFGATPTTHRRPPRRSWPRSATAFRRMRQIFASWSWTACSGSTKRCGPRMRIPGSSSGTRTPTNPDVRTPAGTLCCDCCVNACRMDAIHSPKGITLRIAAPTSASPRATGTFRSRSRRTRTGTCGAPCETSSYPRYTNDPATEGLGIYLVLWFGAERTAGVPRARKPTTPGEMSDRLLADLTSEERRRAAIVVLDVTPLSE